MIAKNHTRRVSFSGPVYLAALLLAVFTLCAALAARPAQAAEWMQPYLEQVQEWGVMRGDGNGNLNEDRTITRAEFVTLVNRAFGYTEVGDNPFTDVNPNAWYAEDISIAHQAGYFNGTSANTASPLSPVTREQAAVLLGRCLRLQGTTGVSATTFNDVENIGGWSRGLIQEAADLGIIQGYSDGTFRPDLPITRGQMACFLVRALGTLIQEPGEQASGGVYGNLTINVPGVKLKDTTITGNLYLTGGVGLGNLELENVTVLGKIVISGSGEAEHGENSIIMRNVTSGGLEVDSLMDQFLSIRAEGLTSIDTTTIRTSAYLEDLTDDGLGLKLIRLDGAEGIRLQLAGNIKEVLNLTPGSNLQLAQGVAGVVTMDEKATGASLTIDVDSYIKELNLDTATPVTGAGSITRLNVNAAGSNVSMLPDTIYVRPGLTGTIANQNMDNKAANESSDEPRLLAGYPAARNVAPTTADAVFRTNKPGTIRWAVTALMDGSLGEEELMNPSSYPKIFRSGTINATAANTDFTARLTGLTREGSYYISALLEDARGHKSPVKVAAFTTPDDTAPNFATGYPGTPILTTDANGEQVAQIMVMTTKACQMYYVLLPKNATAPTAADFRAAALPGNLGYGVVTMRKNTPFLISRINSSHLQEKTDYDLYIWLSDADNGKSSAIRKITITTKDITPPTIQSLYVKSFAATTVTMNFTLSEPGSIYWVVVKKDAAFYANGINKNNPSEAAKIQIMNGSGGNVIRRGGPIRAAQGGTEYSFTVSGLAAQTAYDLYYVALDTAGNYCVYSAPLIPPMEIHTEDQVDPTVRQEFTNEPKDSTETRPTPYPDSTVRLVFSEEVIPVTINSNGTPEPKEPNFETAYQAARSGGDTEKNAFAALLKDHILLYRMNKASGQYQLITNSSLERTASNESSVGDDWIIDYRKATISRNAESGEMIIAFPYNEALKLGSGETYYFFVKNIADTSNNLNTLKSNTRDGGYQLPIFTTMDVEVTLSKTNTSSATIAGTPTEIDMAFQLDATAASSASADTKWDMLIWYEAPDTVATSVEFSLYYTDNNGSTWQQVGGAGKTITIRTYPDTKKIGVSVGKYLLDNNYESLPTLTNREYAIKVEKIGAFEDSKEWNSQITFEIWIIDGDQLSLQNLTAIDLTPSDWTENSQDGTVTRISTPSDFSVYRRFTNSASPRFKDGRPTFAAEDVTVDITIRSSANGTCYYLIAPLFAAYYPTCVVPDVGDVIVDTPEKWEKYLDPNGSNFNNTGDKGYIKSPTDEEVIAPDQNDDIRAGSRPISTTDSHINLEGLIPNQEYIAYFVLRSGNTRSGVYAFRFKTTTIHRPILQVSPNLDEIIEINGDPVDRAAWLLIPTMSIPADFQYKLSDPGINNLNTSEVSDEIKKLWKDEYSSYDLLKAMTVQVRDGGKVIGTVFDLFVLQSVQNGIGDKMTLGGATFDGLEPQPFTLRRGQILYPNPPFAGLSYYLVAVGLRSYDVYGESPYAAAATGPYSPQKTSHPLITSINTEVWRTTDGSYTGTLTINFNNDLYWIDSKGQAMIWKIANALAPEVHPLPGGETGLAGYRSILALLIGGPGSTLPSSSIVGVDQGSLATTPPTSPFLGCQELRLTVDARAGQQFTLHTSHLCNGSTNPEAGFDDGNIILRLVENSYEENDETKYEARFEIIGSNASKWTDGAPESVYSPSFHS